MNVLLIGTGNMTRGISTRLLAGGHDVVLYNPNQSHAEQLAGELGSVAGTRGSVGVASELSAAIQASEVVILASWYAVNLQTAQEQAKALAGKIVVDISNPLTPAYDGLVTEGGPSAGENIQSALGDGARLVKAFNTTFAATLVEGTVAGQPLDIFIAGDDDAAKVTVTSLVRNGGLNGIDVGGLERARQLEALGFLGITLQFKLNTGFKTAWKLVIPQA